MANFLNGKYTTVAVAPITIIQTIGILLLLYFLYMIMDILTLVFLAFILMVALSPISRQLQKHAKMPRMASIVVTYLIFVAIMVIFFGILIPPLVQQLGSLIKFINIPVLQEELANLNFSLNDIGDLTARIGSSITTFFTIVTSTFAGLFTTFTLFIMSFFLLQDRENLHRKVRWFTKSEATMDRVKLFIDDLEIQLGGWVRGELILMLTIGSLTYIGLVALSVPYALPLAILAGALEILPNIGPTIAAVPAIAIAYIATGNPVIAGAVLILNIVIQQLENNVIVPKVMSDNANVSPLVSIVSILIGVKLGGVIGALLAVPLYIVIRSVYMTFFHSSTTSATKQITYPRAR
ncbi:MAG: hypothetical protein QG639_51 [Patescibacteria group bacterium]|jgi:predicted PurR-regulated permease PerM|nr:hypothetical protein [Patescibacteria group bacterium]